MLMQSHLFQVHLRDEIRLQDYFKHTQQWCSQGGGARAPSTFFFPMGYRAQNDTWPYLSAQIQRRIKEMPPSPPRKKISAYATDTRNLKLHRKTRKFWNPMWKARALLSCYWDKANFKLFSSCSHSNKHISIISVILQGQIRSLTPNRVSQACFCGSTVIASMTGVGNSERYAHTHQDMSAQTCEDKLHKTFTLAHNPDFNMAVHSFSITLHSNCTQAF